MLYAQVQDNRIIVRVIQLLIVCVCMKFHILDDVEKVIQEDIEEKRSKYGSLWDASLNSSPATCGIHIANFYPLDPPTQIVFK